MLGELFSPSKDIYLVRDILPVAGSDFDLSSCAWLEFGGGSWGKIISGT